MNQIAAVLCVMAVCVYLTRAQSLVFFSMPDGSFLAGCCRIQGGTSTTTLLEGLPWRLVTLPGQYLSATGAAPAGGVTVQFERGKISGFSGCNTFTGTYTLNGNRITLDNMAVTMMACPEPKRTIERAFNQAMSGTLTYEIRQNRLDLRTSSGSALVFERGAASPLQGTWLVTNYNNGREAIVTPLADTQISLLFESGTVVANAGCNTIQASYVVDGDRIKFEQSATTMKACEEKLSQQEREFIAALLSSAKWTFQGDQLHLIASGGQRSLIAVRETSTLAGRTWNLTGFNNGRQAVVSPISGTQLTLSFATGTVTGHAGCNTFRADYSEEGDRIKIGPAMTTRKMCPADVMNQEREFLKALESATKWTVQGNSLDMHQANGERALTATASPK